MAKGLAGLILIFAAITSGYAGMIYGWGITPQSWLVIIGTTVASICLFAIARNLSDS